jgi:hypothetical protein
MFRVFTDRRMINSGTPEKPYLSADVYTREFFAGPIRYCSIRITKTMENIGNDKKPWYVKTAESVVAKVLGLRLIYRERFWKYDKLNRDEC